MLTALLGACTASPDPGTSLAEGTEDAQASAPDSATEGTPSTGATSAGATTERHEAPVLADGRPVAATLDPADPSTLSEDDQASDPSALPRVVSTGAAFTDVTLTAGIAYVQGPTHLDGPEDFYTQLGIQYGEQWFSGGAAAADYDGDGWVDLYVTRIDASDLLFRNLGDGTFEDVTEAAGLDAFELASNGAGFADVDNDGDPDLYVTTIGEPRFYLFINDGGSFTEQAVERGAAIEDGEWRGGNSVSFGDYDRDGWLDIHTTDLSSVSSGPGSSHARLLRNLGAEGAPGHFEDVTAAVGVALDTQLGSAWGSLSYTSTFSDLDADGWPDLLVSSDWGTSRLFWNAGDGTFVDGTEDAGVGTDDFGMGSAVGDVDGDGRLDWFVTSIYDWWAPAAESGNRLYRNLGDRTFSDDTDAAGVRDAGWGWGTSFLDTDNDGDLDLVATNGYAASTEAEYAAFLYDRTKLWVNDGAGGMTEVASESGVSDDGDGKGLLVFDYDRDGDQDFFVVNHAGLPRLYRNDLGQENDWLRVRLRGTASNRDGVGARVELQKEAGGPVLVRELRAGGGYLGQHEGVVHFGLGAHEGPIHRLEIVWPTAGATRRVQVLDQIEPNQVLEVIEPS